MVGLIRNRQVYRRAASGFAIVLGAGALVFAPISTAGATGIDHWIAGTYQATAPGTGTPPMFPIVLFADHSAVISGVSASWSVRMPNHTVEIDSSTPAPLPICTQVGLPPGCEFSTRTIGPKTATGIATQAAPGHVDVYLGTPGVRRIFQFSAPFWAVRTGPAKPHR